jgi:hypothetical protein
MKTNTPSAIAKTTARATRIIIRFFELPVAAGVGADDDGAVIEGVGVPSGATGCASTAGIFGSTTGVLSGGVCGGVIGGVVGFDSGVWFVSGFISFLLTILYTYSIQVSEEPGHTACVTERL